MAKALLKISNSQVLSQFMHDCVDDLIDRKPISFDSYSSDVEWTSEDFAGAVKLVQNLCRESIRKPVQFEELGPSVQQCVNDCLEVRKGEILQAVIQRALSSSGRLIVKNIDWKLKWIVGSSKLASLREPVLQIDLHCFKKDNEDVRRTVNFEVNIEQLDRLIAELQAVKKELSTSENL